MWRFLRSHFIESDIDFNSKNTKVRVFLFVFLLFKPLFGLFLNLFEGFYTIRKVCVLKFLGFWLSFFNSKVLYNSISGLYLSRSNVSEVIISLSLVVYFLNIRSRLEACFSLNFNRLRNYHFPGVQVLTLLFYLSLYEGFKSFFEEFNKVGLFWSSVSMKFSKNRLEMF